MSSTNEEDPFLQVQRDVQSQLTSTRQLFTSYLRIRSLTTDRGHSTTPELKSALIDLEAALESLAEDVADLSGAVSAAESEPNHFGLDDGEIRRRKRAVEEVRGEIDDMREELAKPAGGGGGGAAGASRGKGGPEDLPDPSSFALDDGGGGEDHYAEFEHRQQEQMLREQDGHLDGVLQTVGNLRRQADDMGRELEEQDGMLNVVDEMADRVGGRLQTGVKKLGYIVRSNEDTLSSCCIGVLILALIILLVLLLIL
ncbi:related to syntaxin family member TLG1 [Cephalotrichum gorgonifer]|uniref:t-SNARE affecting a late Golgi compartment protein 1 n=1 Tax=Cephalotrichum gorgonifer TaxID=2041049 RepID=A0AAE8MVJ9_9PEZI|nr:related to syntaxin family member TLG1 [Cephalotrichum gorgonifer]